jgi:uncharacterized membrane protein YtjA (UPF0391 family)
MYGLWKQKAHHKSEQLKQIEIKNIMIRWAIILLVVALIAGILGATGVMSMALNIAYIIAVIAVILFIVGFVMKKT